MARAGDRGVPAADELRMSGQRSVNPKVVQERLGHASITITLQIYSHVIPTMHDQAADLVAGVIGSAADSNVVPLRLAVDSR
jgi:integrase